MRRLILFVALTMLAAYCTDKAMKRQKPQPKYRLIQTSNGYHLYNGCTFIDSIPFQAAGQLHNILSSIK